MAMNNAVKATGTSRSALEGARSAFIVPFAFFSCGAFAAAAQDASSHDATARNTSASDAHTGPPPSAERQEAEQAAEAQTIEVVEIEATLGLIVEPFDGAAWERRLTLLDLDRRERAVARLEAMLPLSSDAQAWVRAQAQRAEGEVAWTCRMLLRSWARDSSVPGERVERALFVWSGNDDRVLLGEPRRALRMDEGRLDVVVVESGPTDAHRSEVDVRRARRNATLADLVPLPPGAAETELRFEIAYGGRGENGAPLTAWHVLEGLHGDATIEDVYGDFRIVERTRIEERERSVTVEAEAGVERDGSGGLFVLDRLTPRSSPVVSALGVRPFTATMDRLGVYVDIEGDGLVVLDVEPGSVAHTLGVARGDRLRAIDGVELARPDDITAGLRAAAPSGSVAVRWQRGGDGLVIERRFVVPRVPPVPAAPVVQPLPPAAPTATQD
jgi:PDZ domain